MSFKPIFPSRPGRPALLVLAAAMALAAVTVPVSGCKTSETSWQKRNPEKAKQLRRQQLREWRFLTR